MSGGIWHATQEQPASSGCDSGEVGRRSRIRHLSVASATMWEPVALCCFSRRTGCLVLGTLEVIGAAFGLIIGVCLFAATDFGYVCNHDYNNDMDMENCVAMVEPAVRGIAAILVIIGKVQLVCASLMIHGVREGNHCFMCPYLIKNTIGVGLYIAAAGIGTAAICALQSVWIGILFGCVQGAITFLWTYFLLTVRAYYYELKRGEDKSRLVENCEMDADNHKL